MNSPDVPDVLGWARRDRMIVEGDEWADSLEATGLDVQTWDHHPSFVFALHNISVQPLKNTSAFLDDSHRLMQVSIPNETIGWIYFRIEPDDETCTLLWITLRRVRRVG